MIDEEQTKRFHAEIPIELDKQIKDAVPWGTQSEMMRQLLKAMLRARDEFGPAVVHNILTGRFSIVPHKEPNSNFERKEVDNG